MDSLHLTTLFQGKVITPGDADYDSARKVFYGGIDKKPAMIIRAANAKDIQQAITLARDQNLELAIRSGGHSVAGYSTTDGGIVIDLHDMRTIDLDETHKTVWADAGVTAGELTVMLDEHDLVIGFGDTGSVGIGGITLGGGVGFLARKFGLAIDNLLAAEIVTAAGEMLHVDKDTHPNLFWAIRGGGGNFGVVTKFKYALHSLGECYGGMLFLPATPEVISGFAQIAKDAPEELSAIVNIMPAFPMPFVPKEFHGKLSLMILMVYAGSPEEGEKAIAPIRALAAPIADMVKPMRYKDIFMPEDDSYHPTGVSKNMYIDDIDVAVATDILKWLDKIDAPMRVLQFRVLGGAVSRVENDATAYAHRDSNIMCNIASFYETEEEKLARQAWIDDFSVSLNQDNDAGYVNFLGPAEQDRLLDAYPQETLERLQKVKALYDPTNQFRANFNILPKT